MTERKTRWVCRDHGVFTRSVPPTEQWDCPICGKGGKPYDGRPPVHPDAEVRVPRVRLHVPHPPPGPPGRPWTP